MKSHFLESARKLGRKKELLNSCYNFTKASFEFIFLKNEKNSLFTLE